MSYSSRTTLDTGHREFREFLLKKQEQETRDAYEFDIEKATLQWLGFTPSEEDEDPVRKALATFSKQDLFEKISAKLSSKEPEIPYFLATNYPEIFRDLEGESMVEARLSLFDLLSACNIAVKEPLKNIDEIAIHYPFIPLAIMVIDEINFNHFTPHELVYLVEILTDCSHTENSLKIFEHFVSRVYIDEEVDVNGRDSLGYTAFDKVAFNKNSQALLIMIRSGLVTGVTSPELIERLSIALDNKIIDAASFKNTPEEIAASAAGDTRSSTMSPGISRAVAKLQTRLDEIEAIRKLEGEKTLALSRQTMTTAKPATFLDLTTSASSLDSKSTESEL